MQYIFHLFISGLEGDLIKFAASLISFFILTFLFHFILIFIKNSNDFFWNFLLKTTKNYIIYFIAIEFIVTIPFRMLNLHMLILEMHNDFIFYLALYAGRIISLLILCIGSFISISSSESIKYINSNRKSIICFLFCIPHFYFIFHLTGV